MSGETRIDVAMVDRGLANSRVKAQAMIMSGVVYVGEQKILKPSEKISPAEEIVVRALKSHPYVGRGGLKLEKALRTFDLSVSGLTVLDIGAATGGFTDVLLQNGAEHVFAVDVGYGQLDPKLRSDPRVTVLERTNARYLSAEALSGRVPELTVMDVSFISVKLILPTAAKLMQDEGIFCILIKPQFEAGRDRVGKHGVVREPAIREAVLRDIRDFATSMDYSITKLDFSPIKGPAGNIEYLALLVPARRNGAPVEDADIEKVVYESERRLSCIE